MLGPLLCVSVHTCVHGCELTHLRSWVDWQDEDDGNVGQLSAANLVLIINMCTIAT